MRETVLHYLWKFRKLKTQEFHSIDGQTIQIIHPGHHNQDSGPDFLNACIAINGIEWNGHVEIHVRSSEWVRHKHQHDPAYGNVILHVVYECDRPVFTYSGVELIQAEIKDLVRKEDIENALGFIRSKRALPCAVYFPTLPTVTLLEQKQRALLQRLENRFIAIQQELLRCNYNWEQVTYKLVARAFGTKVNKHAFERLAEVAPLGLVHRHAYTVQNTEAALFHFSGLLEEEKGEYAIELKRNSGQLGLKYPGIALQKQEWKFATMRPHNFPTVRIAQLADLVYKQRQLFSRIIESHTIHELREVFNCQASAFWDNHYRFAEPSGAVGVKRPGTAFVDGLLINAAIPLYFTYGKVTGRNDMVERCLDWLEELPAEKNAVVDEFAGAGLGCRSAFDSQALVEQKNSFCSVKKCLNCSIGLKIINGR